MGNTFVVSAVWLVAFAIIAFCMYIGTRRDWAWVSWRRTVDKADYKRRLKYFAGGCFLLLVLAVATVALKDMRLVLGDGVMWVVMVCGLVLTVLTIVLYTMMLGTMFQRGRVLKHGKLLMVLAVLLLPVSLIVGAWSYWAVCAIPCFMKEKLDAIPA